MSGTEETPEARAEPPFEHRAGHGFEHRHAAHCESGVTGSLFRHAGLDLSEPMIFGIGSGLYFFYARFVKVMGMPLVSFRTYPGTIFKLCCRRLGVRAVRRSFLRESKGVRELDRLLEGGVPVGLQTNMFWLRYFPREFRSQFNGHNLIALRRDGDEYELSDPVLEAPVRCSAELLRRARFAKGVLAPRGALYYAVGRAPDTGRESDAAQGAAPDIERAVLAAVRDTAGRMLTPFPCVGVAGMRTLARHVRAWPRRHPDGNRALLLLGHVVRMQEEVGTGGAGFRFMYAAFLQEAGDLLGHEALLEASERMTRVGDLWRDFAITCGRVIKSRLHEGETFATAAERLAACADAEEDVFRFLRRNVPARATRGRRTTGGAPPAETRARAPLERGSAEAAPTGVTR